jgi:hypothetical protein
MTKGWGRIASLAAAGVIAIAGITTAAAAPGMFHGSPTTHIAMFHGGPTSTILAGEGWTKPDMFHG